MRGCLSFETSKRSVNSDFRTEIFDEDLLKRKRDRKMFCCGRDNGDTCYFEVVYSSIHACKYVCRR